MKINESQLRGIIKETISNVLKENVWDVDTNSEFTKGDQERAMYTIGGNRSQYPMDYWYDYDNDKGQLAMDALKGEYDPDYVDEFDPEMTPTFGDDPNHWKSVPKGTTIKEEETPIEDINDPVAKKKAMTDRLLRSILTKHGVKNIDKRMADIHDSAMNYKNDYPDDGLGDDFDYNRYSTDTGSDLYRAVPDFSAYI